MFAPSQRKKDDKSHEKTGIPAPMQKDFENATGMSFADVRVHYNSDKPKQVNALAYTQGTDVFIGAGNQEHLPHELGHVVQQKQGRVRPTESINGMMVNSNPQLEAEADNILPVQRRTALSDRLLFSASQPIAQFKTIKEVDDDYTEAGDSNINIQMDVTSTATESYRLKKYTRQINQDALNEEQIHQKQIRETGVLAPKEQMTTALTKIGTNYTSAHDKITPFVLHIEGNPAHDPYLESDALFANACYGYVVGMTRKKGTGAAAVKKEYHMMTGAYTYATAPSENSTGYNVDHTHAKPSSYASTDNVSQESLLATGQHDSDICADNETKILAEGARWNAVKALHEAGKLNNQSKFYAKQKKNAANAVVEILPAEQTRYILFQDLWKKWKTVFGCKWGITDETFCEKLNNNMEGSVSAQLNALTGDNINYGLKLN